MDRAQLIEVEKDLAAARLSLAEAFRDLTEHHARHLVHPDAVRLIREHLDRARLHTDENIRRLQRAINETPQ